MQRSRSRFVSGSLQVNRSPLTTTSLVPQCSSQRVLCSAAEPGAILVAGAVRELAVGKGFTFEDAGELVLKGFDPPVRAYRLCVDS